MHSDRTRWDARYAAGDRRHDVEPAPRLVSLARGFPPGRALDLAAGLGRHALLLARAGWTVDAVDISLEALETLKRRASDAGLRVNLVVADLDVFECRPASYDLAVQTFFLDRSLAARLARWVRPGGHVYVETHRRGPTVPTKSRYALDPGELRAMFDAWQVVEYEEGVRPEGARQIDTARLVARRAE